MVTLTAPDAVGSPITASHFGANFVFSQDRIDGTFPDRADAVDSDLFRYPGGAVAELLFDPGNPNADSVEYTRGGGERVTLQLEPYDSFLEWAVTEDKGIILVVPVRRYIDEFSDRDTPPETFLNSEQEEDLRSYIRTGLESGARIDVIEMGNEPIQFDQINNANYGALADEMALILRDEIDSFEAGGDLPPDYVSPLLSFVSTPYFAGSDIDEDGVTTWEEAFDERMSQLSPAAIDAIDALSLHRYINGDYNGIDNFDAPWEFLDRHAEFLGGDVPYVISEWNIGANQSGVGDWENATEAERDDIDTGLKHAGAVAALFHEMVANDVDVATIWALQQQNDTALASREGNDDGLSAGGEMFAALSQNVRGMRALEMERPSEAFDLHGFADREGQFLVLNSRSAQTEQIELDVSRLVGPVEGGEIYIMTAAEGQDPRDPDVETVMEPLDLTDVLTDGALSLTLDPWEVAVLAVDAGGDRIQADGTSDLFLGGNGDDEMLGTNGSEAMGGGLHDDVVRGGGGNDRVGGGDGDDRLWGGWGKDSIQGGAGDDTLYGQNGVDRLFGQEGDDLLAGGDKRDVLYGARGDDTLIGGPGHDLFRGNEGRDMFLFGEGDEAWREIIHDFDPAEDVVELRIEDLSFEDLVIESLGSDAVLNYGGGSIYFEDTDEEDLSDEVILLI